MCPFLALPNVQGEPSSLFIDYRFNFPSGPGSNWTEQVLSLGYGSLYNHSDQNNAYWYSDNTRRTFNFVAKRDIEAGEEIFTYYGSDNYWNEGRKHTEVI